MLFRVPLTHLDQWLAFFTKFPRHYICSRTNTSLKRIVELVERKEITFLVWSWMDFILRTCCCTLLRIRKNGERALFSFFFGEGVVRLNAPGLSVVSSLLSVLNRTGSSSSKIKGLSLLKERKSVYFVHCPNRVQSYTRYCRWFRLLYLNRARVSPLWGTVTPQANMEVTLPHSGKNCGHRSVSSPFPFFRLWNYSVGARWKLRDHSKR